LIGSVSGQPGDTDAQIAGDRELTLVGRASRANRLLDLGGHVRSPEPLALGPGRRPGRSRLARGSWLARRGATVDLGEKQPATAIQLRSIGFTNRALVAASCGVWAQLRKV
jgi:hypothetical protein